jgi:hypothetical protein
MIFEPPFTTFSLIFFQSSSVSFFCDHLLAVAAVRAAARDLVLLDLEVERELGLEARRVERGERRELARSEARVEERREARDVRGVEDDDPELEVGRVLLDVLPEALRDLAVPLEQVLARHALLAGEAARGDQILRALEALPGVRRPLDRRAFERAVEDLLRGALEALLEGVVHRDVTRDPRREELLDHVGADRARGAEDRDLRVREVVHARPFGRGVSRLEARGSSGP